MREALEIAKTCECGCGEFVLPGNRFVYCHHCRGKKQSKEMVEKRVQGRKGYKHSEKTKRSIGKGNTGKVRSARTKALLSLIGYGKNHSNYGKPRSEETKEKLRKANKGQIPWLKGKHQTEEAKEKIRKKAIARTEDPRNAPNWQGGISARPYCEIWLDKEFKESIRERDDRKCQNCGMTELENGRKLDLHHVDYVKTNCDPFNLITLCRGCNLKANKDRDYWQIFYQEVIERKYKKVIWER